MVFTSCCSKSRNIPVIASAASCASRYLESDGENTVVRPWVWILWLFFGPVLGSIAMQVYIFTAVSPLLVPCLHIRLTLFVFRRIYSFRQPLRGAFLRLLRRSWCWAVCQTFTATATTSKITRSTARRSSGSSASLAVCRLLFLVLSLVAIELSSFYLRFIREVWPGQNER